MVAALALVAVAKQEANGHDRGSAIAASSGEKKPMAATVATMSIPTNCCDTGVGDSAETNSYDRSKDVGSR